VPLVVFAGAEYGNGSSRGLGREGNAGLLGVPRRDLPKPSSASTRSNLVGMGRVCR